MEDKIDKVIYSHEEVSELLGVSIPTLYRWQAAGFMPMRIRIGPERGRSGFHRKSIEEFVESRKLAAGFK